MAGCPVSHQGEKKDVYKVKEMKEKANSVILLSLISSVSNLYNILGFKE